MAKQIDLQESLHIIGYGVDPGHPRYSTWSFYFSGETGPSYANWDKAYNSVSLKNTYLVSSFNSENSFSKNVDLTGRLDFAVAYKNQLICEIAFDIYQKTKWSSTATLTNTATGSFSIQEKQKALELLIGYNFPFHHWDLTTLIGAAYIGNRDISINDKASTPNAVNSYKNAAFYSLAYGIQSAYTFETSPKLSVTLSFFGLLGKDNVSVTPSTGSRHFSINMPIRGSLLLGIRYRI